MTNIDNLVTAISLNIDNVRADVETVVVKSDIFGDFNVPMLTVKIFNRSNEEYRVIYKTSALAPANETLNAVRLVSQTQLAEAKAALDSALRNADNIPEDSGNVSGRVAKALVQYQKLLKFKVVEYED